jgi:hypothetical protein
LGTIPAWAPGDGDPMLCSGISSVDLPAGVPDTIGAAEPVVEAGVDEFVAWFTALPFEGFADVYAEPLVEAFPELLPEMAAPLLAPPSGTPPG